MLTKNTFSSNFFMHLIIRDQIFKNNKDPVFIEISYLKKQTSITYETSIFSDGKDK